MSISNEVHVSCGNIFANNKRVGYVIGNENCTSDGTYTVEGTDVYCRGQKVGHECGVGEIRMNDGTIWQYL